jgi:hypothetical protein
VKLFPEAKPVTPPENLGSVVESIIQDQGEPPPGYRVAAGPMLYKRVLRRKAGRRRSPVSRRLGHRGHPPGPLRAPSGRCPRLVRTVGEEGPRCLPHTYGAANDTVVANVSGLPAKVSEIYRKLTSRGPAAWHPSARLRAPPVRVTREGPRAPVALRRT